MINETSRVRQNARVAYRELQEGGVLLHLDTGHYHGVNATGRLIWSQLAGDSVSELVGRIRNEFEEPPPDLKRDVVKFLQDLHDRGLVELSEEDSAVS